MQFRTVNAVVLVLTLATLAVTAGCPPLTPSPMQWGLGNYPIPVSPYFQKKLEYKAWDKERYDRLPILAPLAEGAPHAALDPPSQDEVMRALESARPLEGGFPFLYETQRNNVRIVVEPIADFVDPPRVYPMVGPAQLHHARYKCTVYFTQIDNVGWPLPHTVKNEDAEEVVYIDHDHLHMVGNVEGGPGSEY